MASSVFCFSERRVTTNAALVLPASELCSSLVSLEFRKGMLSTQGLEQAAISGVAAKDDGCVRALPRGPAGEETGEETTVRVPARVRESGVEATLVLESAVEAVAFFGCGHAVASHDGRARIAIHDQVARLTHQPSEAIGVRQPLEGRPVKRLPTGLEVTTSR